MWFGGAGWNVGCDFDAGGAKGNEMKKNRIGYTLEEWCKEADIDMRQFSTHNLPGRWAQMWHNNVYPKNVLTMKDKNGHNLLVGDKVRFFPRGLDEEWYEGVVVHIEMTENKWESKFEPVARIKNEDAVIPVWQRYGGDIEKIEE